MSSLRETPIVRVSLLARIVLLVIAGISAAGCELAGGIFKAGMWVGSLAVILVVVLVVVAAAKLRG